MWASRMRREQKNKGTTAGLDANLEAPPLDRRTFCSRCVLIKAMRAVDAEKVGEAQSMDDRGKPLYLNDPMIAEDQHVHFRLGDYYDGVDECQHIYQDEFTRRGMFSFGWDGFTATRWDLLTHGGFHTWPHHDASGMATWILMRTGCKIWCPLIPNLPHKDDLTQHDLFPAMYRCLQPMPALRFQHASQSLVIFALPRDIM